MTEIAAVEGKIAMGAIVVGIGDVRVNLTLMHFSAGIVAWHRVRELEQMHAGMEFGGFWDQILQQSIAGVISTAAALECYVNELFVDRTMTFPNLPQNLVAELWERKLQREPVLVKFASALRLRADKKLETGIRPAQDVDALLQLRNGLVHFKPEWFGEQVEHARLSELLHRKFERSAWFTREALFPRAWASASCLEWALSRSAQFLDQFEGETGLPAKLEHVRAQIPAVPDKAAGT